MSESRSVLDVIPLHDLDKMSRLQERAVELEHQAHMMLAQAQDLRVKADDIVVVYRIQVEKEGWEACRAEAKKQDMISWHCDPLPGQGVQA
ncbi:MAG: hypothetical protein A4E36_01807 [Methanoregulaceae archaeon PtaB.Bin009]|nr:MAG: hypothetical protein A4E36_01807 [Methanoregulaceae archaeon PtaB.Bin009]